MVGLAFVLESSFVSITGLLIGALTGIVLGDNLVGAFFPQIDRSIVAIPWRQDRADRAGDLPVLAADDDHPRLAGGARIYPAEALRYE